MVVLSRPKGHTFWGNYDALQCWSIKIACTVGVTSSHHQRPENSSKSPAAGRHQRRVAREKSIRHGHPSTLHLWWARRPLAAARAVIFAQMVNDPGYQQGGGFTLWREKERRRRARRLFRSSKTWCCGRTPTTRTCWSAPARNRRSWRETCELNQGHPQAADAVQPRPAARLHDPLQAAARCRWRRSAWGWKAMPATSTPWPSPSTRP